MWVIGILHTCVLIACAFVRDREAKNLWGIRHEEDFPMLHLAILLVLGTRRMVAQRLMEAALQRMQEDPTRATLLAGFLNDLLLMLQ